MEMDGNEATGTLSVGFSGGRPSISGTVALQTLDLTRYAMSWRSEAARSLLESVVGPGPFALPLVSLIDADLRISANRVRTGGPELGPSAAALSIKGGKLLADIAEVDIDGVARGSGQLSIDTNGTLPRYVVRGKIAGVDLGRLVPESTGLVPIQGRGDVVVDVAATGDTGPELIRTSSGKISLAMPAGGRIGLDLKALVTAAQQQPLKGWSHPVARGSTTVENLQSRLVLSEGVIYTESFSAALNDGLLTASGGGNLRSGLMDMRLSMASRAAADRSVAGPQQTVESIVLQGPWNEPSIQAERQVPATIPSEAAKALIHRSP